MEEKVSLAQAAAALNNHYGPRLDAGQDEGRELMAGTLCDRFSLSAHEAERLVKDLERARSIRWRSDSTPSLAPGSTPVSGPLGGTPTDYTSAQTPIAALFSQGYWQLTPG